MLISRGAVYRSAASAGEIEDGNRFHDNDMCIVVPVYTRQEFRESDSFKMNREYEKLWPKVTRGLSGKAAVSAWRKYIRERAQEAPE